VEFVTYDLDGEARGTIALVVRGVRVVIGKVEVGWDVGDGLCSKAEQGWLVKVGAKVLYRFEKITAVTGNVNVGSLHKISVGQVQRGLVERVHLPKGTTVRSVEYETPNARRNPTRNPEWWGDLSQLQPQNHEPGDTEEFKFNQNLNLNLYCEIRRNFSFSISTS